MKARLQAKPESRASRLFLRIKHPEMDPREITRVLGIDPIQTVTVGGAESGGVRRVHSESYWIAQLPTLLMHEAVERYRAGVQDLASLELQKLEDLQALHGASDWDARILFCLRECKFEEHRTFLQQVIREGGSVAMIVDRGEERLPVVIRRALATLVQLGIELEVD